MLKKRIIPILLHKDYGLVKGKMFNSWRRVGSTLQSVRIFNMREVDELIFLDITASEQSREPDYELIKEISSHCFMPLSVGGGISKLCHIEKLLRSGADKICINSAQYSNQLLINEASNEFGSQCIIASVDFKVINDQTIIFSNSGKKRENYCLLDWLLKIEQLGAGEVLLTSIDREGMQCGYDIKTLKEITNKINIPVIAAGGAGSKNDVLDLFKEVNCSAAAISSLFFFTEITPNEIGQYLDQHGVSVRKKENFSNQLEEINE